ncbi:MAG TPA: aminotransferase class V-fold PLP-dependent enzyme [Terracidiphilus sp.]|nr:aminotransferase class V-fold PLP-dependent enzyme [Terracidiphilus sp.]
MAANNVDAKSGFDLAYADFVQRFPEYVRTTALDELRATEYRRLDELNQVYLDYTAGSLYAQSQIEKHLALLRSGIFGNPHSSNPSSTETTRYVESCRQYVLHYFHASPEDYILVFTVNASGGLKLVGESFPFAPGGVLLLTFDNHNSVNGIREFARAKGAEIRYAPLVPPALRIDFERLEGLLDQADPSRENLFAYPLQSNFSGVKHPLELVAKARSKGWRVLLDAAAYVPTNRLDLTAVQPDFVTISFYKMFGYPTGVGALLVRKSMMEKLERPWFAGGTVNFVSVQGQEHVLSQGEAAFEDGTLNYLSIPAVEIGLRHIESIGIEKIGERVRCLTGWVLEELLALRHSNGHAMVRIYGPTTTETRGGTVTLNLYDPEGHLLDYRRVEELAGNEGISLRIGCFCNPGTGEIAEGLTDEDMRAALALSPEINLFSFMRLMRSRGHKSAGAIRVSLGLASNFADVWRFLRFVEQFRDQALLTIGEVSFDIESCRVIRDGS